MNARASIIIPCHNYGKFLAEAIESALNQTLSPHEVIVVDDGSSDHSPAIAHHYEERGVRVIAQANQGAIATFNTGIRASTGEYFVILSADDRLDTRYLERTIPLLDAHPSAGYVYTAYRMFGAYHRVLDARPFSLSRLLLRPYIIATTLMRRGAFDECGGFSAAMEGGHEDWDFFVTLAERGWFGVALPEVLFHYRKHSTTSRNALSLNHWLDAHRRVHQRHHALYRLPLKPYLGLVVLNHYWLRLQAAPSAVARRFGPLGNNARPARIVRLASSAWTLSPPIEGGPSNTALVEVTLTTGASLALDRPPESGDARPLDVPPPSRSSIKARLMSQVTMATRAVYLRGTVYWAGNLQGLLCGVIAASFNRAALLYEPRAMDRASGLTRRAYSLVERLALLRCDTIVTGPRAAPGARWPMPPLVLDSMPERLKGTSVPARQLDDIDRQRLDLLYHDLLNIPRAASSQSFGPS